MKYNVIPEADGLRIGLQEKLGFRDHQDFRRLVTEVLERKPRRVNVDLSGVSDIDSAGLGLLVILNDRLKQVGAALRLSRPSEDVKHLLTIVEFDKLFTIDAEA